MEEPRATQRSYDEPQAPAGGDNAAPVINNAPVPPPAPLEKWSRTVHPRGRQVRDPLARSVQYQCSNLESMKDLLREYLANPTNPPEHTTIEFSFPTSAAFLAYTADFVGGKEAHKARSNIFNSLSRTAVSVIDALNTTEPKDQMNKQKAIARTIVESIAEVDGYRYSFHNNWLSKEDEACRFSYYCNDSTLNKGRAANEGAGMSGKKKVKPVYDCKGILWIKFSITKNNLEVHYKHIPIHKTYEERAPPPRKDSKRRKLLELFNPDKLPKPGQRKRKDKFGAADKPRKRRATEPPRIDGAEGAEEHQDESLAPLMDFLGSAGDKEGNSTTAEPLGAAADGIQPQNEFDTPIFPAEKLSQPTTIPRSGKILQDPKYSRTKKPQLPGMMSGYMAGDLITWGDKHTRNKSTTNSTISSTQQTSPNTGPLAGIANAAAATDTSSPPGPVGPQPSGSISDASPGATSELEQLKAKLAAAEARIHNLESEKTRSSSFGPPGWPPTNPPPQQQQQYNYPPPPGPPQQYPIYHATQYQQSVPVPVEVTGIASGLVGAPVVGGYGSPTMPQGTVSSPVQGLGQGGKAPTKKGRKSGGAVNGSMGQA